KGFGSGHIAISAQEEIHRPSGLVHGPTQVDPTAPNIYICLVHPPGSPNRTSIASAANSANCSRESCSLLRPVLASSNCRSRCSVRSNCALRSTSMRFSVSGSCGSVLGSTGKLKCNRKKARPQAKTDQTANVYGWFGRTGECQMNTQQKVIKNKVGLL